MIKEVKVTKEITETHRYCDICGKEIKNTLQCSRAVCQYCRKDLCEDCVAYEAGTPYDSREVYCKSCNEIRLLYQPKIDALEAKLEQLYQERQQMAKLRYRF